MRRELGMRWWRIWTRSVVGRSCIFALRVRGRPLGTYVRMLADVRSVGRRPTPARERGAIMGVGVLVSGRVVMTIVLHVKK